MVKNGVVYITLKLFEQVLYGKRHVRARRGALCRYLNAGCVKATHRSSTSAAQHKTQGKR